MTQEPEWFFGWGSVIRDYELVLVCVDIEQTLADSGWILNEGEDQLVKLAVVEACLE